MLEANVGDKSVELKVDDLKLKQPFQTEDLKKPLSLYLTWRRGIPSLALPRSKFRTATILHLPRSIANEAIMYL
jgi:hypothetical protein